MDDWQPDKRHKDEVVAFSLGVAIPGAGQLYAEDWALGSYFLILDVATVLLWMVDQWPFALIAGGFSWIGGLWLVPNSIRKFQDRENRLSPTAEEMVRAP